MFFSRFYGQVISLWFYLFPSFIKSLREGEEKIESEGRRFAQVSTFN